MESLLSNFTKIKDTINLYFYFNALYRLICNRYDCVLDNAKNIARLEKDFCNDLGISTSDSNYIIIKQLAHYEIRMALPIKDVNSYKEKDLIGALNKCINRYLKIDPYLFEYIKYGFNKEFVSKLIYEI